MGEKRVSQGAPRADAQAYGAAAAACARGLDDKAAVRLLGEMREAGLRPGRPMFGAVIDACARRGKWEQAVALLEVRVGWAWGLGVVAAICRARLCDIFVWLRDGPGFCAAAAVGEGGCALVTCSKWLCGSWTFHPAKCERASLNLRGWAVIARFRLRDYIVL